MVHIVLLIIVTWREIDGKTKKFFFFFGQTLKVSLIFLQPTLGFCMVEVQLSTILNAT